VFRLEVVLSVRFYDHASFLNTRHQLGLHIMNVNEPDVFVIRYWEMKCMLVVTVAYVLKIKPKVQNFNKKIYINPNVMAI
jgi:hypothetical protein